MFWKVIETLCLPVFVHLSSPINFSIVVVLGGLFSYLKILHKKKKFFKKILSMSKLFFRTLDVSNPSFPTRTPSTDLSYPRSYTRLIAGIVMIFTLGKPNEDSMIEKMNISRPLRKMSILQLLLTISR